jgi:hypothetical protein
MTAIKVMQQYFNLCLSLVVSHDHLNPYPFLLELSFFVKKISLRKLELSF